MSNKNIQFDFQVKASNAISELLNLRRIVWENGMKYKNMYTQKDLRSDFFINISMLLTKTIIDIDNFDVTREKLNILMKLIPSGEANFLLQIDTINRRCFITEFMFNIEFFLNSLILGLQPSAKPIDYKLIIDEFNKLILCDDNKRNILYAPYLIRNSIHNNGHLLRLKNEFSLNLKNNTYKFKIGLLEYTGWDNLIILIEEVMPILVEIIESNEIKNIIFIPSPFENESKTGVSILDNQQNSARS